MRLEDGLNNLLKSRRADVWSAQRACKMAPPPHFDPATINKPLTVGLVVIIVIVAKVTVPHLISPHGSLMAYSVHLCWPDMPYKTPPGTLVYTLHTLPFEACCGHRPTYILHRCPPQTIWTYCTTLANRSWCRRPRCVQGNPQDGYQIHEERMVPTLSKLPQGRRLYNA
jgi:hypothetical protein